MTNNADNVKSIFITAIENYSPDQWPGFLDDACGDDAALRGRVEELLQAHVDMGSIHTADPAPTIDQPITEKPGVQIGPYKLLEQIGEGGMGVVYMAEQTEPVERRVALKVIKPGMDSRQVIARFEAERQALAMMDHPNIARVLDAGTTDESSRHTPCAEAVDGTRSVPTTFGRPYFVMELVKGLPITDYCDQQHLTPRERLELFVPVCQAVQHAHQKGIIHRDLKPSNVLIALYDDRPVPKVIDFGVAKAITQKLTERTMFTRYGQLVGTLDYMSPEQADLNQLDIDTRSDVYSLGVLLYELLTGATPFDRQRLRSAAFDELLRIIREEEPPRPSLRLSTLDTLPSVAANRHTEPKRLSTLIRGELDWIVMKALEKDRTRRYETATGIANDIQRYLRNEPVRACPPSAAYRLRKFARRNKAAMGIVSIVVLALILGLVGTSSQAVRATRAERIAQKNFQKEQQARQQAIAQRDRARRAEESASQSRDEAVKAEQEAKRHLFDAYLAQAKASRYSGRPGQRVDALNAVRQAVELLEPLGLGDDARCALRNEAIGAMSLVDLSPLTRQRSLLNQRGWVTVSADCRFAAVDAGRKGPIRIHSIENPAVDVAQIVPVDESDYSHLLFLDPTMRYLFRMTAISTTGHVSDLSLARDAFEVSNVAQAVAVDFHPARAELAVGDMKGVVRFLELPSGRELRQFSFDHPVRFLKYSPGGRSLAISGTDGSLEIRDADTGAVSFLGPPLGARTGAWRPDGAWIALGAASDVHLLEIREKRGAHLICRGHQSAVINVHFEPRTGLLASCAWDGTIRLWDAGSGHQLLRLEGYCLRFSSDGRLLAGRQGLDLVLWEIATPDTYRWLHKGMTGATAVAPDGRLVVSSHDDGVRLWDLKEKRLVGYLPIGLTSDVAFHPVDGSLVTSGNAGLHRWPVTRQDEGSRERVRLGPAEAMDVALARSRMVTFSGDGRSWLVEASHQDEALVVHLDDMPGGEVRLTSPRLVNATLSPDGSWAAASCEVGRNVRIWNARTGEQVCILPTTNDAQVRFSPDNRRFVTNTGPDIGIWEVGSWRLCHEIPCTCDAPSGIAFTSDSRFAAVGLWGIGIRLIEVETGETVALLETAGKPPVHVDLNFSPDDTFLTAAVDYGGLCVWDMREIRRRLAELGLDWEQPPLPQDEATSEQMPLICEIDLGDLGEKEEKPTN